MQNVYVAVPKPKYDAEVLVIQHQLNSIRSALLHNLPAIKEDGYYGYETAKAVRAFQQACNISADGKFGPQSYASMMQKLREMPSPGAVSSKYSIVSVPEKSKEFSPTASFYKLFKSSMDVFSSIADNLQLASEQAAKQLAIIQMKYQNGAGLAKTDIQGVLKSMWEKPSIQKIRNDVEKKVMDEIRQLSHGNTNRINYKTDKRTVDSVRMIGNAQRQLKKGPNSQTVALINKNVAKQLVDKCTEELRSVQFDKKISQALGKMSKGAKVAKGGGAVLTAITLIPLCLHVCELCYNLMTNNPIEQNLRDIAADIVEFVVGTLIALAVAAIVAAIGITGGMAVLAVVVIGIVIGLLMSFFLDEEDNTWSDKLVNWTYETYKNTTNTFNSQKPILIDFQRTGKFDNLA